MPTEQPRRPPLEPDRLADAVPDPRWQVELVPVAGSTNAEVVARARAGAAEGLVVVTDHQTAGRGRLDRTWVTPAGAALTFSVLLVPAAVPAVRWPWLPLLTGLAVREGVRRTCGVTCALKWPNDLLVDDAKVAGILVERVETPQGAAAVVGVGVNVSQTREELPVDTATSLELATGHPVDRTELLGHVLDALADRYDEWCAAAGDPAGSSWTSYQRACATVGRPVRVALPDGSLVTGTAVGVDREGRLLVADTRGHTTALGAGDVVHVRPRDPRA